MRFDIISQAHPGKCWFGVFWGPDTLEQEYLTSNYGVFRGDSRPLEGTSSYRSRMTACAKKVAELRAVQT